ncbi:MAG: Sfum_1244 family protein, partial [Methanobacteriota archaeon]
MNIEEIVNQVRHNCEISNARSWGGYSICGLLLRLRELYKWEIEAQPWAKIDTPALMSWIDEKERKWKEISNREFRNIEINGILHNPFDVEKINEELPQGFLYGAGYVAAMRPSFFLA